MNTTRDLSVENYQETHQNAFQRLLAAYSLVDLGTITKVYYEDEGYYADVTSNRLVNNKTLLTYQKVEIITIGNKGSNLVVEPQGNDVCLLFTPHTAVESVDTQKKYDEKVYAHVGMKALLIASGKNALTHLQFTRAGSVAIDTPEGLLSFDADDSVWLAYPELRIFRSHTGDVRAAFGAKDKGLDVWSRTFEGVVQKWNTGPDNLIQKWTTHGEERLWCQEEIPVGTPIADFTDKWLITKLWTPDGAYDELHTSDGTTPLLRITKDASGDAHFVVGEDVTKIDVLQDGSVSIAAAEGKATIEFDADGNMTTDMATKTETIHGEYTQDYEAAVTMTSQDAFTIEAQGAVALSSATDGVTIEGLMDMALMSTGAGKVSVGNNIGTLKTIIDQLITILLAFDTVGSPAAHMTGPGAQAQLNVLKPLVAQIFA